MNFKYATEISVEIDPRGICRDGSITGYIKRLGVSQRDIIELAFGDVKYVGIVTEISSPLKTDLGTVQLQSLVMRLGEVHVHTPYFKKTSGTFSFTELINLLISACEDDLAGAVQGFVGISGQTNISMYTPNTGSLLSNLSYLANIAGLKVLGINGNRQIVFGSGVVENPSHMDLTIGSTTKSKIDFPNISSQKVINSVGIISGWTSDEGRIREERIGAKIPVTFWYRDNLNFAGVAEEVFQLPPKSVQYDRIECTYSFVRRSDGQPIGYPSGPWVGSTPPAADWSVLYDGNLDTMFKIDGYADIEPSIAIQMKIPAGQRVDGFFIAAKDEPKLLWSMLDGENPTLVESLISQGYRAQEEIFPKAFIQAGSNFPSQPVDISSDGIWTPNSGAQVVGEFVMVQVDSKLSAGSNFTSRYDVLRSKEIKVPTTGQEVVVEFETEHGAFGAVKWKHGVKLKFSAAANENRGAIIATVFGTGGTSGVGAAYWNFYASAVLRGYAMSRVIDEDEKNTPDYATLKGYVLSPLENVNGVTITLVWNNPGWLSPYFPQADPTASVQAKGRFLEALTFFELYPVRINDTTISQFAKTRMKPVANIAATVQIESFIQPVDEMSVTLVDGTVFTERVAVLKYIESREAPTRTIVQLGQAYSAEATTQAAIIVTGQQAATFDAVEFTGAQE